MNSLSKAEPIYVTEPYLPPLQDFVPYLEKIWTSKILTNAGPFHQQFEAALCQHLGVRHVSLFANGTLALIAALKVLGITGEVITTPFSFVATAHALLWSGLEPVFVDIDPGTFNLDATAIEAAITPRTRAIMPVHCYGRTCDVGAIQKVADEHGLKVIYDAAHAFAVDDAGGSILRHGDLSVLSFHATKVFNTFEGGAIICPDEETKIRVDQLKNFGFVDEVTIAVAGINCKMNEFSAALGLLQLRHIDAAISRRGEIDAAYRDMLRDVAGIRCAPTTDARAANFSYFPILVDDAFPIGRDELYQRFRADNIFVRRYFFPLLSAFPMYRACPSANPHRLPVATDVANRVICLPIYPTMTAAALDRVISVLRSPLTQE